MKNFLSITTFQNSTHEILQNTSKYNKKFKTLTNFVDNLLILCKKNHFEKKLCQICLIFQIQIDINILFIFYQTINKFTNQI